MFFPPFRIPVANINNANPGTVGSSTTAAQTITLAVGNYKVAALEQPIQWKLGSTPVTATTGSLLAPGDQEVFTVDADNTLLTWIRTVDSTADGRFGLNPIQFIEIRDRAG